MRLLLDTHALIWWLIDHPKLPKAARSAIASPDNHVFVSLVSAWEIAIKRQLGKIDFPLEDFESILDDNGMELLPIALPHIISLGELVQYHRDPFDRLLIVQALEEKLILVTGDEQIASYGLDPLWM